MTTTWYYMEYKKKVANKFVTMSEEFLIQNGEMTWLLMAILD